MVKKCDEIRGAPHVAKIQVISHENSSDPHATKSGMIHMERYLK
jgi:hypothetical protein